MNRDEAYLVLQDDLRWLVRAGFVVEKEDQYEFLEDRYAWFMQGKLNLKPHHEIQILRRMERATDLGVRLRK